MIELNLADHVTVNNATDRPEVFEFGRVHRVWGTLKNAPTVHVCVSASFDWGDKLIGAETTVVCSTVPASTFGHVSTPITVSDVGKSASTPVVA